VVFAFTVTLRDRLPPVRFALVRAETLAVLFFPFADAFFRVADRLRAGLTARDARRVPAAAVRADRAAVRAMRLVAAVAAPAVRRDARAVASAMSSAESPIAAVRPPVVSCARRGDETPVSSAPRATAWPVMSAIADAVRPITCAPVSITSPSARAEFSIALLAVSPLSVPRFLVAMEPPVLPLPIIVPLAMRWHQ